MQTESYRTIELTQGQVAIVDAEDYERLSQWKWCAHWSPITQSYYAERKKTLRSRNEARETGLPRQRVVHMSRVILGLEPDDPRQAEHGNHDTLDNRRSSNLRVATNSQNHGNIHRQRNNTSGYKGVSWDRRDSKYRAQINVCGHRRHLGCFDDPCEAAQAYDDAALEQWGEFAYLNFPRTAHHG